MRNFEETLLLFLNILEFFANSRDFLFNEWDDIFQLNRSYDLIRLYSFNRFLTQLNSCFKKDGLSNLGS